MAFSQTPSQSTYTTKTVKLLNVWESRDATATKDNEILNCFYEMVDNKSTGDREHYVVKRDGTSAYAYTAPSTNIRGIFYWEDQDKFLVAYNRNIDVVVASTGAAITVLINVFTTTTGEVGFTEFYYDDTTVKVVTTDGTTLSTIDTSNVVVASTSPDIPVPHLPHPLFLDGYLFIAKANTADIYNSNLNDPLLYTAGDFISAEMAADKILRIAKLNNYLVALGSSTIQYYYDAANATGSPLAVNDTPVKNIGYVGGLVNFKNQIYFVGSASLATPSIFVLEDFKVSEISDAVWRRYIKQISDIPGTTRGSIVSFAGHEFYVLTASTLTYGYDLETKKWHRFAYKAQANFPIQDAVEINHSTLGRTSIFFLSGVASLLLFNPSVFQDSGTNFTCRVTTDNDFFDTLQRKTVGRLLVHADRPSTDADLSISVSDDDYQTFSTARTVNLNQSWPVLHRYGQFRRRAHKLELTANVPMRLYKLELEVNMGQS